MGDRDKDKPVKLDEVSLEQVSGGFPNLVSLAGPILRPNPVTSADVGSPEPPPPPPPPPPPSR